METTYKGGNTVRLVRCIYGSGIQKRAEAAGMTEYCDQHCGDGYRRGWECPYELRRHGINVFPGK